jgi:hypothetical protein
MPIVVSVLVAVRSLFRSRGALHLEILALRHQLQGFGTLVATARASDRSRPPALGLVLAHLDRLSGGARPREARDGRCLAPPRLSPMLDLEESTAHEPGERTADVRALVRTMSDANPLWGAPRVHGELRTLGITVSQSTVAKYMGRRRPSPFSPGPRHPRRPDRRLGSHSLPLRSRRTRLTAQACETR